MRLSGVNLILRNMCVLLGVAVVWAIFTDAGFANDTHIIAAFSGYAALNLFQRTSNTIMSRLRVPVEWGFGMIKAECPFITRPNILKLRQKNVSRILRNCVLLTNIRCLMMGNQTSHYFECETMTMREYFA